MGCNPSFDCSDSALQVVHAFFVTETSIAKHLRIVDNFTIRQWAGSKEVSVTQAQVANEFSIHERIILLRTGKAGLVQDYTINNKGGHFTLSSGFDTAL